MSTLQSEKGRGRTAIVLCGAGHVSYGLGMVSRVRLWATPTATRQAVRDCRLLRSPLRKGPPGQLPHWLLLRGAVYGTDASWPASSSSWAALSLLALLPGSPAPGLMVALSLSRIGRLSPWPSTQEVVRSGWTYSSARLLACLSWSWGKCGIVFQLDVEFGFPASDASFRYSSTLCAHMRRIRSR